MELVRRVWRLEEMRVDGVYYNCGVGWGGVGWGGAGRGGGSKKKLI